MPSPQQTEEPTASLGTVGLKIQRPPPLQTPQYAVASAQPTYSYPAPNHRPVNQSAMNYPQANCPQHQVIAAQPAHLYFGPSRLIDDPVGTPPFVYPRETLGKQDTPYASGPSGYSAANVLTAITAQRHLNYASSPIGITSSSPREPTPSATPYPAAGPMADNHVFNKINTRIQPSASANGNSKTLQFINYNDETAATGSHMSQEASKKKSGRGWKYDISRIKTLQSPTAASPPPSNILAELPKSKRSSRYDASAIRNLGKDITAASKPPHIEIPKKKDKSTLQRRRIRGLASGTLQRRRIRGLASGKRRSKKQPRPGTGSSED